MSTFQSTLLQEERHHRLILMISARIFQSTLLQEERLQYRSGTVQLFYFNPRSYKRSNCNGAVCTWKDCNFNPRSYKRSDKSELELPLMCDISIHAPTRGATENCKCSECPLTISIHAPTRGATLMKSIHHSLQRFQSTLLQEERPVGMPHLGCG